MHSQTFKTPFITPRSYHRNVVEQQANFLLHYENDCSYKGHYITYMYAIPRFRKGLT